MLVTVLSLYAVKGMKEMEFVVNVSIFKSMGMADFYIPVCLTSAICSDCHEPALCVAPEMCECPVGWTGDECSEGTVTHYVMHACIVNTFCRYK